MVRIELRGNRNGDNCNPVVAVVAHLYLPHMYLPHMYCSQEVLFLDTDLGQSEFTPPGLVSLVRLRGGAVLGPPCTHMMRPEVSHFVVSCGLWMCGRG